MAFGRNSQWKCRHEAQWLESQNSNPKTLGLIPWRGRVSSLFCVPPHQLLCRLGARPLLCVYGTHHICAHVKDPMWYISVLKGRPHSRWYGNTKTAHKKEKKLGSAILWLLAFPGESSLQNEGVLKSVAYDFEKVLDLDEAKVSECLCVSHKQFLGNH